MPHVEIVGALPLTAFHDAFRPREVRDGESLLKVGASFIARDERSLLLDCMTVEGRLRQSLFVIATARPEGVLVRVHPRGGVERTPAVKRLVAWIALWIAASAPGAAHVGTTNLAAELGVPFPAESTIP